jgi:DNA-binding HxlR family transcriptional regulator
VPADPPSRRATTAARTTLTTTATKQTLAAQARAAKLPMTRQQPAECACVVGGVIDLIGKKWTMCIVVTIGNRPGVRFNQLQGLLDGISPRTLSDTLKSLESEGLVAREAFAEIPPRVEYRLTAEGRKLLEAVAPLMAWASSRPGAVCQPQGAPPGPKPLLRPVAA